MRRIFTLFLFGTLATACMDRDYDLGKVQTDNISIGNENSTFEAPLANVYISMEEINDDNGTRIDLIFTEADIWLPTRLPDSDEKGYYADVQRLLHDAAYVNEQLLPELLDQMSTDTGKLDAVATLLQEKYYDSFMELLPGVPRDEFKRAFVEAYTGNPALREALGEEVRLLANDYLTGLDVEMEKLDYPVDRIDISDDVVNMLCDNLDPRETVDPKNTLYLAGTIDNRLPVSLQITPLFTPTNVNFTSRIEAHDSSNELPATRLFADDLRTIVRGIRLEIPIVVEKYYPGLGFDPGPEQQPQPQLIINLRLVKHGALKFDL